jgi:hypothetical protein
VWMLLCAKQSQQMTRHCFKFVQVSPGCAAPNGCEAIPYIVQAAAHSPQAVWSGRAVELLLHCRHSREAFLGAAKPSVHATHAVVEVVSLVLTEPGWQGVQPEMPAQQQFEVYWVMPSLNGAMHCCNGCSTQEGRTNLCHGMGLLCHAVRGAYGCVSLNYMCTMHDAGWYASLALQPAIVASA